MLGVPVADMTGEQPLEVSYMTGGMAWHAEYVAVLGCDFTLRTIEGRGVPVEVLWKGGLSRSKPFPANNQLWSLGSTSALINESELERSLGDVAEQMGRDAVQSMLEDF